MDEDKFFAGAIAVIIVLMGGMFLMMGIALIVSIWQAGLINFIIWMAVFYGLFLASRFIYRKILENEWI